MHLQQCLDHALLVGITCLAGTHSGQGVTLLLVVVCIRHYEL